MSLLPPGYSKRIARGRFVVLTTCSFSADKMESTAEGHKQKNMNYAGNYYFNQMKAWEQTPDVDA